MSTYFGKLAFFLQPSIILKAFIVTPSNYLKNPKNQKNGNLFLENFGSASTQTKTVSEKETKEEIYNNSLKKGKISLSQNDFKSAKKAF